jgi:hypothetical protein
MEGNLKGRSMLNILRLSKLVFSMGVARIEWNFHLLDWWI